MTKETNQTLRHRFRGGDCGCRPFMDSVLVGGGGSAHSQWERTAATPGSDALPGSGPGSRSGPGPVRPRPTMEAWVRFSAQSQARERLLRCSLGFRGPAGSQEGSGARGSWKFGGGGHRSSEDHGERGEEDHGGLGTRGGGITGVPKSRGGGWAVTDALGPREGGSEAPG